MKRLSPRIVADFGSVAEIGRLVKAPHSTAKAWRIRISDSRLHHLQLAAAMAGKTIAWDTLEEADPLPLRQTA